MELWVRSQNKKTLSKVEMIGIENDEKSIYMQNQDMFERLGTYETKERALQVLTEIQNVLFKKTGIIKANSLYSYEDLKNVKKDIEKLNNDSFITIPTNFDFIPLGNAVFYQMPKE